jgi:heme oxygenase
MLASGIVARKLKKLRKLNLSEIQVLQIFSHISQYRALHWKGFLVPSNTRAVSECWAL